MNTTGNTLNILIAGWFSFEGMGTTAGDLIAKDIVCNWLNDAGIRYDVAVTDSFFYPGAVRWEESRPEQYTDIIFLCGPFGNGWPVTDFLAHFPNVRLIGMNLSLLQSLEDWNPFTLLYERDSSRNSNPDITFYGSSPTVPVVGVILAHKQKEYGHKAMHELSNSAVQRLINSREMSVIPIDTCLENNKGGLRTPGEVEAMVAKMDVVITTRLHGTVLALKNGVPVISIDPIAGGAKITRQVRTIGWPLLFDADNLEDFQLLKAFDYCLTEDARLRASECTRVSIGKIESIRRQMIRELFLI